MSKSNFLPPFWLKTSKISLYRPENTIFSYPYILKSICLSLLIFLTVLDIGLGMLCMNFHQLGIKTEEIMLNRQKDVEKTKKLYTPQIVTINLVHPVRGARAPYITKSISLQIRNPNLYSRKVSERQLAQIIFV